MSDRDELGAFLSGFLIGGLVGAAVALLTAPQSGEETRAQIRDKSVEIHDKAQVTVEDAYARAEAAAGEARKRADELALVARERADYFREHGQVILEEQKAKIQKAAQKSEAPIAEEASDEAEAAA